MKHAILTRVVSVQGWIGRCLLDEDGQGLVEYALILAFVVIVVYFALRFLQPQISRTLNTVSNGL